MGHSETDSADGESYHAHLVEIIALCKELKLSDGVPVSQSARNQIVKTKFLEHTILSVLKQMLPLDIAEEKLMCNY